MAKMNRSLLSPISIFTSMAAFRAPAQSFGKGSRTYLLILLQRQDSDLERKTFQWIRNFVDV